MDKYTKVKTIGKGNMGTCTLARNNDDGKYYVIKQVDLTRMSKKDRQQSLNEARVLSSLRHPNIINYVDSFLARKSDHLCIVMEYAESGDVSTRLRKNYGVHVPERQVLDWFIQLVLSLQYVHQRKILHRDVKTQNIFLTNEDLIKLGDFGIARTLANTYDQAQTFVGTPYYLSPELILEKPYNHHSDVWALGVVLYELLTLKHPFNAKDMKGLLQRILAVQYDPLPATYSAEMRGIVPRMLVRDPAGRIELSEILDLPIVHNRIEQWLHDPDAMPRHYVRSLCKHHLLPIGGDGVGVRPSALPSPRSAARAAAAVAMEHRSLGSEPSSEQSGLQGLLREEDGLHGARPEFTPAGHYPVCSTAARAAALSSSTENAIPDRIKAFMPPLKSYRSNPPPLIPQSAEPFGPSLPSVSQRCRNGNSVVPTPANSSHFSAPPSSRIPALPSYRQQSEPGCPSSQMPVQRVSVRTKIQSRPYHRPYVAQPRTSSSPYVGDGSALGQQSYLLLANQRKNVSDARLQHGNRSSGLYLNPLYRTPRQAPAAHKQLSPLPLPPSDIKAMLHRAAADRVRRRQEFT